MGEEREEIVNLLPNLLLITVAAGVCHAYCLDTTGLTHLHTCIEVKGGMATLTGYMENISGETIRHASWCIRAKKQKDGCLFPIESPRPWKPGENKQLAPQTQPDIKKGLPLHVVLAQTFSLVTVLDNVQRIFVSDLQGSNALKASEQMKALIGATERFKVVDDPAMADATIIGFAEERDIGQQYIDKEKQSAAAIAGPLPHGVALAGSKQTTDVQQQTSTIVTDSLAIRLVLPSGETIWAWPDTTNCSPYPKTRCAIDALVNEATR